MSGSKPKSNCLQQFLDENNTNYDTLKTEFKKCKKLNNIDCWNDLTKQLNEEIKTKVILRDMSSKNEIVL
jgi:hypothetical protein